VASDPGSGNGQLAIVIFAVANVRRAVDFYTAAMSATEVVTSPNYVELDLGGTTRLGLYERVGFGQNVGRIPASPAVGDVTSAELYFRVASLPAAIEKLERTGARLLSPARGRPWGETAAYFADPDGNVVAVAALR
jgi:catechol 2,3-dioxygenase-like lactoylglutathione lyase family enzyme